jgi:dTDP-glucose 4,6-dehydratase
MTLPPLPADDLDHVLAHTRELWAEARARRIFLTGGTGFFGPWLVETFAHANERLGLGAELVVLTRDPDGTRGRLPHFATLSGVTLHRGDVRDFEAPAGDFDLVVHGATESSQQGHVGDNRHMFDTIVDGTRQTLGLARSAGASRYLLLSSGAVYGRQPPDVSHVAEDYVGGPSLSDAGSAYGEGKRAAEVLAAIEAAAGTLSVRVARCFAFVGPHLPLDIHFAIGNFIRDAMNGGPIRIRGDGTAVRSYMYMADLAIWLWTLALHPKASGPYNVGSEEALSVHHVAGVVAATCAPNAVVKVDGERPDAAPPSRYVPMTNRASQELGLHQTVELSDGIARTHGWYAEQFRRLSTSMPHYPETR